MAIVHTAHATYQLDVTLVSQNQGGNYSTVNIHLYAYADSGWSGFANGIGWSVSTGQTGSVNFNGTTIEFANFNVNVGHDGNGNYGTFNVSSHTNATGTSTYGGPVDMSQGVALPRIPKVPGAPGISAVAQPGLKVAVTVTAPADNGGSGITQYSVQYSKDGGAWTGTQTGGSYTYTGLVPGNYVFRTWATNGVGNSAFAQTGTVTVLAGGYVWDGTSWKASLGVYVWNGSSWVLSLGVYTWNGSAWTIAL